MKLLRLLQTFECESCFYVKSHLSFYYYNVLVHCISVVFALVLSRKTYIDGNIRITRACQNSKLSSCSQI